MILIATSLREVSMFVFGFGPSSRLSPSMLHASLESKLKAKAVRSARIAEVSVDVANVCQEGISQARPSVRAAAISSPERSISSLMNSV